MTDAKETRAHAFEIKFVVDAQMGERIRAWARTVLDADPHGTGPFGDEYRTSTLYLDTAEGHVFHRWGSYGRAKYRIRRYGDAMCQPRIGPLTLDQSLRVAPVSRAQFNSDPGEIMFSALILELKFKSHLPTIFKQLVEECHLSPQTASKYRLGMAALDRDTSSALPLVVWSPLAAPWPRPTRPRRRSASAAPR